MARKKQKPARRREPRKKPDPVTDVDAVPRVVNDRFVWTFYVVRGKRRQKVSEAEYKKALKTLAVAADRRLLERGQAHERRLASNGERVKVKGAGHCWPLKCEALAVHPSQVAEMTEHNRRHGVNVTYDPKWGTAIVPTPGEYKKFRRLYGVHERNSYND